jgi:hypothetical protein
MEVIHMNQEEILLCIGKWQKTLKLQDWDIQYLPVEVPWRKSGDIKIDDDNRNAVLMLNRYNPKRQNLEEIILHELLHLRLRGFDVMIEELINLVYGIDEKNTQREFAYSQFMLLLETTVQDVTKSFFEARDQGYQMELGRLKDEISQEIGTKEFKVIAK